MQVTDKITLWSAIKDLGWFSSLFAIVVAGPSLLSLFQAIFVEHHLIKALQWIVDGYNAVTGVLGGMIEPLARPIIHLLNSYLGWSLELQPHWRPLFVLSMIVVMGGSRAAWRHADRGEIIWHGCVLTLTMLLAALVAGVIPLSETWWVQVIIALAPISTFLLTVTLLESERVDTLQLMAIGAGAAVFLGAGLSFFTEFARGSGLITLAILIAAWGFHYVWTGLARGLEWFVKYGLTILGGFVTAAIILAADAAIRTWSSAEIAVIAAR